MRVRIRRAEDMLNDAILVEKANWNSVPTKGDIVINEGDFSWWRVIRVDWIVQTTQAEPIVNIWVDPWG